MSDDHGRTAHGKGPSYAAAARMLSATALTLALTALSASRLSAASEEGKRAGWLRSGSRTALADLPPRGMPAPTGRFDVFAPTDRVGALLSVRDTLWIGTGGGLFFRAAGADTVIRAVGPVFTAVTSIARGDDDVLWVGGPGGISIRRAGGWRHWTRQNHPFFSDVTDIRPGGRRMWISTWGGGCGYVERDSLTVITRADSLLDDRVTCVEEENNHTIWIGTESGVCRADSFSWRSLRYGSRIPVGRVRDLSLDEEGGLFVAVARRGVARYSLGRVSVSGPSQGLPSLEITRFGTDSSGRVIAAGEGGASAWDGSGWTPLQLSATPHGYEILSVATDLEGNTFFGTGDGRCLVVSREGAFFLDIPPGFPESSVTALSEGRRALWICGVSGVYRLATTIERYPLPSLPYEGTLSGIVPESGGAWVATRFGILHQHGGSWEVFDRRQGLPTEHFTGAAAGPGTDLWFATFDRGVLRLGGKGWIHYTRRHGLPGEQIVDLLVDARGTPWIATRSGNVARLIDDQWEALDLPAPSGRTTGAHADSASAEPVLRYLDAGGGGAGAVVLGVDGAGRVLIASGGSLYFESSGGWRVAELPVRGGPGTATCCAGTADGAIWVGTRGDGVYVLGADRWFHADDSSGLGSRCVTDLAVDREGAVWIGTSTGGVTRYTAPAR